MCRQQEAFYNSYSSPLECAICCRGLPTWEGVWIAKFLCSSFQRQEVSMITNKIDESQPLPSPATSTPDPNLCHQQRLAPFLDWTAVGVYFYRHGKNVLPLQLQAHYQPR